MKITKYVKRGLTYILHGVPQKKVYPQIQICRDDKLLAGRTAFITGASSGIGLAIAKEFALSGANVILVARNEKKLQDAKDEICSCLETNATVFTAVLDITDFKNLEEKVNNILSSIGTNKVDILVNNAGVNGGIFFHTNYEEFDKIINTNLKSVFFLTEIITKHMIKHGIEGNVLNIASSACVRPAVSAYQLSKWALRGLTQGLARSLAPHGIVVNGIAPGPTATPMLMKGTSDGDMSHKKNLAGRFAMPEEIASMAVKLVSSGSRCILGDIVFMSGGGGLITNEDYNYNI